MRDPVYRGINRAPISRSQLVSLKAGARMFRKMKDGFVDLCIAMLTLFGFIVIIVSAPDVLRKFHKTVAPEMVRSVPFCTMVQIMRKGDVLSQARLCPGERFEFTIPPEPSI
jgi:hypothetical protein